MIWHMFHFRRMASNSVSQNLKRKSSDKMESAAPKKVFGHWSQGLKAAMEDPEMKVEEDDQTVIIKDKYPKARHHFLVMPRESIPNLRALKMEHLPLLKHMQKKGEELAARTSKTLDFRFGYHGIPSMSHVHMHVISQDFDSPCLKTKKHWNSFTSEYFIDSEDVITMLEDNGKVQVDTGRFEQLLKQDLKCHVCKEKFSTIPALKKHIVKHISKGAS